MPGFGSGEGEILMSAYCMLGASSLWGYIRKKEVAPAFGASGAGGGSALNPPPHASLPAAPPSPTFVPAPKPNASDL